MAARLLAKMITLGRAHGSATDDASSGNALSLLEQDLIGDMALCPSELLPEFDYCNFRDILCRQMQLTDCEALWLSVERLKSVFGVLSSNAIRARPSSPFDAYVKNLKRVAKNWEQRSQLIGTAWDACRQICNDTTLPANLVDKAMWQICGVEAGCLYRLQSKCNHCCDCNAESQTFAFADCTLDLRVCFRPAVPKSQFDVYHQSERK